MEERQKSHVLSTYYAPRGHERMYALGMQLAQLYLSPNDKLIGFIGDAGSGKSALIRGMFPGMDLTNDDDGVYVRPLPILDMGRGFFSPHSYHLDIRFENAFTQLTELAEAITNAVSQGKRVIVEHYDLVYHLLPMKADLLVGVGERVLITRPNLFGPDPRDIRDTAYKSLPHRLMAHTAEDLCEFCMPPEDLARCGHDDALHGFVISFPETAPQFDIKELEAKVQAMIDQNLPITYIDDHHISIGGNRHPCAGPRIHVSSTGMVKNFHLLDKFLYDRLNRQYLLVGCVGDEAEKNLQKLVHHRQTAWE